MLGNVKKTSELFSFLPSDLMPKCKFLNLEKTFQTIYEVQMNYRASNIRVESESVLVRVRYCFM